MSFFDCDNTATPGSGSGSGSGPKRSPPSLAAITTTLATVSTALFFCGAVPLAITPFLEPKQMIIPAIIGYSCLLIGTAALGAMAALKIAESPLYSGMQKFRVGSIFFSLILILSIMISRYTKYKSEIVSGNVPQLGTFTLLIIIFIGLQLYEILKLFNKSNAPAALIQITSSFSSTLLFYKLVSYILVICLTIALKYYVTDG
jgi:hypothetical protein